MITPEIIKSSIKAIDSFNDYDGIDTVMKGASLFNLDLLPVDIKDSGYWQNDPATIVFTLKEWNVENTFRVGEFAKYLRADEFQWQKFNGQYIVRLWWD